MYKQVAALLTANVRIAAATYRITLTHARYSPVLHNWPGDARKIALPRGGSRLPT